MHQQTLAELSANLNNKSISSKEMTEYFLQRIAQFNTDLNAFITPTPELALAQAAAADQRRAKGETAPLLGIPIAQKDIFCTQGVRTSCGSKMLDNFIAPYNATIIDKFNQAGSVMLGKTNMDEFAMGSSNENSFYGPVKNPWNTRAVTGGSSGGSACAVAAGLAPAATATDTGGSIRQPSSLCGLTGIKPTYGRVSRYGMIAFASSLDQAGVMTKTAEDAAMVLNVMAGFDDKDSTSVEQEVPDYTESLNNSLHGLKIGIVSEFMHDQLDSDIEQRVQDAIKQFEALGAQIQEVSLPHCEYAEAAYYVVAPAECSSNLSRFDGVRYGYRCENPVNLEDLYKRSRGEGFGAEVKRRIMIGTHVLSTGYYDAFYLKAQKVRRLIRDDYVKAFANVDLLLSPTSPTTAFDIGSRVNDPVAMYLSDRFTVSVNLAGLPALSIPCGLIDGLPVGLQMIAPHFQEARLLNAAHQYQQQTDWHLQRPEGF